MFQQPKNKVHFYLMEIVFVILMITIASTICLTAFTKANKISNLAEKKTEALARTTAWIEQLKAQDQPIDLTGTYYHNKEWENVTSQEEACFKTNITQEAKEDGKGILQNTKIEIESLEYKSSNPLLAMELKYYYPSIEVSKSER